MNDDCLQGVVVKRLHWDWANPVFLFSFFLRFYLLIHERHREREREAEREAGSSQGAQCGTRSWIPESCPEPKAEAQLLSPQASQIISFKNKEIKGT